MNALLLITLFVIVLTLAFLGAPVWLAVPALLTIAAAFWIAGATWWVWGLAAGLAILAVPAIIPPVRRFLVSDRLFGWFRSVLPVMSATEREALEAGSVWWDGEIFSGRPRWKQLLEMQKALLSDEEQAFLDGPVEELCAMLNEWEIIRRGDLPPEIWDFLRAHRFFSMIIPREYGGLGFSAQANGAVIIKIASRSMTAAVTVMVPNSLGPGELLHYFGTDAQKNHYLPRLAAGEDLPCFALTGPLAGSDAASMPDSGVACKAMFEGRETLGFRVNFDKRYITLAPVATVIGLAFKAEDPDGLLGDDKHPGITCALLPSDIPGLEIGARHLPTGSAFLNGPIRGRDIFVPMDWVIGGRERVGHGWRMLMHCLSAGRAISLPALAVANAKLASMLTGAYARIRHQFRQPIGAFEGVQEALARIAGETYRADAAHKLTLTSLDTGEKPAVLSAILKASLTEANRRVLNDAMDVHGGKAVVEGPRNYLTSPFQSIPVAITVEGANILTRSMIIFGQGAIRCHPWLLKEMRAAMNSDERQGRREFDSALWGHLGYLLRNAVRAPLLALSGGRLSRSPVRGPHALYFRRINRMCAAFTLTADVALLILGGRFKTRERLSGRFADALSHLYLASAALKRFEDDGCPAEDLPLLRWAAEESLHAAELALCRALDNFPSRGAARVVRFLAFPLGPIQRPPDDHTGQRAAQILMAHNPARDRLIAGAYRSRADDGAGVVLAAFDAILDSAEAERAIHNALKRQVTPVTADELVDEAISSGVLDEDQGARVRKAQRLVERAIAVDEFNPGELMQDRAAHSTGHDVAQSPQNHEARQEITNE